VKNVECWNWKSWKKAGKSYNFGTFSLIFPLCFFLFFPYFSPIFPLRFPTSVEKVPVSFTIVEERVCNMHRFGLSWISTWTKTRTPVFQFQDSSSRIPVPEFQFQDSSSTIPVPGFQFQNSSSRIPVPGFQFQDSSSRIPVLGFQASNFQVRLEKCTSAVLTPLGKVGSWIRAPLKPLDTIVLWCTGGFRRGPHWFSPLMISRDTIHREIFSKSYWIKPKSDCIYHFPIDLEPNGRPIDSEPNRTTLWFRINLKMVNTIWFLFDLIRFGEDFYVRTVPRVCNDQVFFFHGNEKKEKYFFFVAMKKKSCVQLSEKLALPGIMGWPN